MKNIDCFIIFIIIFYFSCINSVENKKSINKDNILFANDLNNIKSDTFEIVLSNHEKSKITIIDTSIYQFTNDKSNYRIIDHRIRLDSIFNYIETSKSILIEKDDIIVDTLYIDTVFTLDKLANGVYDKYGIIPYRNVICTSVNSNNNKMIRLDFDYLPSAPGDKNTAIVQFESNNYYTSEIIKIYGDFEIKNDNLIARYWSGYFSIMIPFKIKRNDHEIYFDIDTSVIKKQNDYLLFDIGKKDYKALSSDTILIIKDIFAKDKQIKYLPISINDQINLISVAIIDTNFRGINKKGNVFISPLDTTCNNLWEYGLYWLNFTTKKDSGWTRSQQHYMLFGLQPIG